MVREGQPGGYSRRGYGCGGALIEAGSYEEEYVDDSEKYDEINIEFLNADNKYTKDTVGHARDDWNDSSKTQIYKSQTVFVKGITSQDQAKREAILRLQQSQSVYKRVRFIMDIDAINFEVGDVIQVQHDSNKYSFSRVAYEGGHTGSLYYIKTDPASDTLVLPSNTYGSDGKVAWRKNSDDTWEEQTIQGPFDTQTNVIFVSSAVDISPGDPVFIGRASTATYSDFDLIRVEEINIMGDHRVEVIGYNYDASVYTHADYGTTAI